ncbi:ADP-ribose glycohydrolase OARD1-like [Leptinotarsa decemlineata]|uniref:ADP-ribose glycohydrolase OARD1-like n=1 Tax=Leptinotarsa decemlineata TaxID=7539 RepID=UPI003D30646A
MAEDLQMSGCIAVVFNKKFGELQTLQEQNPEFGRVLQLKKGQRNILYLITKKHSRDKPSYEDVRRSLTRLRNTMLDQNLVDFVIPKLASGLDKLDWRIVGSML